MKQQSYVGRFAPSPSGLLHYGSLVTATASYLQAKHNDGQWLLRIEDIDPPREISGATDDILFTLERFEFEWDQAPLYQSTRLEQYRSVINNLVRLDQVYACSCSRKDLANDIQKSELGKRYPGTCANKKLDTTDASFNLRLRTENKNITFQDATYGEIAHNLFKEIGDIIVYRKFDIPSYALAVTVDDAYQGITEVVRGFDLLAFTPVQIYLSQQIQLPIPRFLHIPIIVNERGQKLSKQTGAAAVAIRNRSTVLIQALNDLGQLVPKKLESEPIKQIWSWAIKHWNVDNIPKTKQIYMS
ncbi:MAG: tRNA glutamyl-Q(34) synthetase GluQRS [Gammaproteobacteria bacterium]|nr:tRNA glutamyl-Q(34) synthetase GluQRS [Gammaproteobacteria bacterium]MBT8125487.1 tRNA glutamyl-Q(34) synthetase GluQRS [Gammaproteobacteria bacterium]NNC67624.1 tRNA glutamyl-Q(34) synthetase GluQRS [Gammaproteobacteria bacterium]